MGFFITEEKELPEFSNTDANKVLKVDPSGVYLQWLQETTTPAELPSQAGNNGRFLTTNGSVPSWAVVNQVPTPSAAGQILNSTGAGTYSFSDNPTIDIIRTGSGSSSGLRIGASNTGLYGLSSSNVMGIITGNIARQTWDSNGSTISVPLTVSNGLCLTFTSQATNRTLSQTDTTFQRINYTSNNVIYTLTALANGTQFWFNPFYTSGTFTCTLTTSSTSISMETYYDGVRNTIPITGSGTIPPAVTITMGYIYQCVYFANVTSWLIIRHGTDKNGVVGNLTITSNLFVQGTGTSSIAGQLNLTTAGSAAAPTLLFGDSTVPQSGIWGSDDNLFFGTAGSQRMNISNSGASITGDLTVSGRATIPNVVYPFDVFTSSGSTADFTLAQNTRSYVRLAMDTFDTILRFPALVEGTFYRIVPFRNGTTATLSFRPANSVIMHLYSGGSRSTVTGNAGGTIGYSILPGTFYECLFSSGAWYVIAGHPVSTSAFSSDVSVGGALSVTGNLTTSQQIIQPFSTFNVTANSQTFDLFHAMSGNVVILMGSYTPVTVRFNTTGFVSGSQFDLIPHSNLTGAVLNFTVTGGATLRIYQGGLVTTHSAPVAVSKDTTYRCEFHDNVWYITSNFVSGNANFPGTVTAIGFSSSGSASITNNLTVGGYVDTNHVRIPAGQEVRFGTTDSLTNCVRGGTESGEFFVSVTVNSLRNVIFRPTLCSFDKSIEQLKCPIQEFDTYNTSGQVTLGAGSPPIIFISRPTTHNVTCKLILPVTSTSSIPEGWTIKIIHVDLGGSAASTAEVEFKSASVNLWADGTQTAFNADESKIIPVGSVWTIMNHKGLGKWYVTGWSKP